MCLLRGIVEINILTRTKFQKWVVAIGPGFGFGSMLRFFHVKVESCHVMSLSISEGLDNMVFDILLN